MKLIYIFAICLLTSQFSIANTFFCAGRAGPFQLDFSDESMVISGLNGKTCSLPEDKSFNSDERFFFQVLGTYDTAPEEVRKLDLPELVSPDGYLSYGGGPRHIMEPACVEFFKDQKLRNFYIQKQMTADEPENYRDTVINVFTTKQGWPILYLNLCVKKSSGETI